MNCECYLKIYESLKEDSSVRYGTPSIFNGTCEEGIKKLSSLIDKKGVCTNLELTSSNPENGNNHRYTSNFLGTKVAIAKIKEFALNPYSEN